jgi:hypothetical protein
VRSVRSVYNEARPWLASGFLVILVAAATVGCGASTAQVQWNLRFATAGGRGLLVLKTQDVAVAERVTLTLCGQPRTELLAESEAPEGEDKAKVHQSWRAVFPLTPTVERCLAAQPKLTVAIEGAPPPAGKPQPLALDEWSAQKLYERVQAREIEDLTQQTAAAKEQDYGAYVRALEAWMRAHPGSLATEQARKEVERARGEVENERREAEEKARAAAAAAAAEEARQRRIRDGVKAAEAAVAAADHKAARAALQGVKELLQTEAEQTSYRQVETALVRLERLAEIRARFAPRLVPKPRKLFAARRIVAHDSPDPHGGEGLVLDEGDAIWAVAGAAHKMVGFVREERADLGALLARGGRLEDVEGWVEAGALTPKDKWKDRRRAREDEDRSLYAGRSEADRADLKRLAAAGKVLSPRVQLGLLRKGYAAAETRRLALLLDTAIRAAADANDPRMPAICAGLGDVVRAQRLADCAAAARSGAADDNVAAIARDFGENAAGFASTFSLADEATARLIMGLSAAP